jgi:hypothetical protein
MNGVNIRTAPIGHPFTHMELMSQCKAVWAAVAWPGKRPGFAVVVGMDREPHFDSHDVFLLDEYESFDMRQLIHQCGVLSLKYSPDNWVGDHENDAASRFIEEMNAEQQQANRNDPAIYRERFSPNPTTMLEMENLYPYILPQIKDLLNDKRRQLFLKDSKVLSYLSQVEEGEITDLELGAYPAIEALAFAVIELREHIRVEEEVARRPQHSPYDNNILMRGFKNRRLQGPHRSPYDNNILMRGMKRRG